MRLLLSCVSGDSQHEVERNDEIVEGWATGAAIDRVSRPRGQTDRSGRLAAAESSQSPASSASMLIISDRGLVQWGMKRTSAAKASSARAEAARRPRVAVACVAEAEVGICRLPARVEFGMVLPGVGGCPRCRGASAVEREHDFG